MSDTKEKDEMGPQDLPVATAVGQTEPEPQTQKLNGEGEGNAAVGSDPLVVVKQDDSSIISETGSGVPMDSTEAKVSPADVAKDNKIGSEAETKVLPADVAETKVSPADVAETKVDDMKIGVEAENNAPPEAAGDEKVGNASTDNAQGSVLDDTVEKQAEKESLAKASSGDESVAVKLIPDGTVAKDGAPVSETETPVKPDEPASDTVAPASEMHVETAEASEDVKTDVLPVSEIKADADLETLPAVRNECGVVNAGTAEVKAGSEKFVEDIKDQVTATGEKLEMDDHGMIMSTPVDNGKSLANVSFLLEDDDDGSELGTEMEQAAFMKELENFFRERSMEFKPPKFYGEGLNLLKLWRAVMRLGGYDKVTSCKLWRQVGESFRPPKTCTTVSWTFRGFYEKALLDYERHKVSGGEVTLPIASQSEPGIEQQGSGSGRARRDAAARAMQGWHSQRLLGNGEVSDPIIKDKTPVSLQKRDKQLRNTGLLKRKKSSYVESAVKVPRTQASKSQLDIAVVDLGLPADWVKINVQRTKDCFEIYALVPGLLREEVRVQSDPAGRLVISGEPEHPDNPWGVTPFKKVISLPSRIDPHQTSAVVTLHGQLFIRVPFEQSE